MGFQRGSVPALAFSRSQSPLAEIILSRSSLSVYIYAECQARKHSLLGAIVCLLTE